MTIRVSQDYDLFLSLIRRGFDVDLVDNKGNIIDCHAEDIGVCSRTMPSLLMSGALFIDPTSLNFKQSNNWLLSLLPSKFEVIKINGRRVAYEYKQLFGSRYFVRKDWSLISTGSLRESVGVNSSYRGRCEQHNGSVGVRTYVKSHEPPYNQEEFDRMVKKGSEAWKDIGDVNEWVADLRGTDE